MHARYEDGRQWYMGEVAAVHTPPGAPAGATAGVTYDIEYDDGDFEEEVPLERVLAASGEVGRWEYLVMGPQEASMSLPNDQTHPWWPNAEQFVDFAVVEATTSGLAGEVAALRDKAPAKYAAIESKRPWPLEEALRTHPAGEGGGEEEGGRRPRRRRRRRHGRHGRLGRQGRRLDGAAAAEQRRALCAARRGPAARRAPPRPDLHVPPPLRALPRAG